MNRLLSVTHQQDQDVALYCECCNKPVPTLYCVQEPGSDPIDLCLYMFLETEPELAAQIGEVAA